MDTESDTKKLKFGGWTIHLNGVSDASGFASVCCLGDKRSNLQYTAVKSSVSTEVFRFRWSDRIFFYKEFKYSNLIKQLKVRNRGRHLYEIAREMQAAGLETPRVVCYARKGTRVFVVSEEATADESVYNILMGNTKIQNVQRFRYSFGQEVGRLHEAGFVHGDLRWGNILARGIHSDRPSFIFIDNDRTRHYEQIPVDLRIKNLVQIKYPGSLLDKPESDWDVVWEGYISTNNEVALNPTQWKQDVDEKNAQRVAAWWKKPRNRHLLKERNDSAGVSNAT